MSLPLFPNSVFYIITHMANIVSDWIISPFMFTGWIRCTDISTVSSISPTMYSENVSFFIPGFDAIEFHGGRKSQGQ